MSNNFILMLSARRLFRKRCQGFLAFVKDVSVEVEGVDNVPVVVDSRCLFGGIARFAPG